jgi:hypothetical protein
MSLASTNDSLVLRDNGEHPPRKTPFQGHPRQERIAYLAIGEQLFVVWSCQIWSIFDGPETIPTGNRDDWSGIGESTTKDDPLIPPQTKRWLDEAIWSQESDCLLS